MIISQTGQTSLWAASCHGQQSVVQYLTSIGANTNLADKVHL